MAAVTDTDNNQLKVAAEEAAVAVAVEMLVVMATMKMMTTKMAATATGHRQ
jgi:hypothetical protein